MRSSLKASLALGLIAQIFIVGCSNETDFSSSDRTSKNQSEDATKGSGKGSTTEQDEIPSVGDKTTEGEDGDQAGNDAGNTAGEGEDSTEVTKPSAKEETPPEILTVEKKFETTVVDEASIKFNPKVGLIQQEFKLTSTYENKFKPYTQITRQNVTKMYKQGTPGMAKTEALKQSDQGILDLVVVIDNSGSMSQEQANLSTKLAPLLEYIKDSDWRIGVVTTDPANGCSRAVIKKGDANISTAFANAINAGIAGSGNEQGIRQAVAALGCSTAQFIRPTSTIGVLIVSDEDNCSNNGNGCSAPYNTHTYLTDYLKNTMNRKLGSEARVYGIYWDPNKACATGANKAVQYAQAVAATSGTSGSICDADYTTTLLKISQDVATILKAEFTLQNTPDAGSVKIKINGVDKTSGFSVVGNKLSFTDAANLPPKGAAIDVSYTVGAVPLVYRYGLGETPAAGTLKVQAGGNMKVLNTHYTFDSGKNEVVFKTDGLDYNDDIKIDFLRNDPLTEEFPIGAGVKKGSVKAKINTVDTTKFSVSADGVIKFDQVPTDGALIELSWEKLVGPDLYYTLPLMGTVLRDVYAYDKATNDRVGLSIDTEKRIIIDKESHVEGRVVVLRYKNEDSNKTDVTLPYTPIMDTIDIASGDVVCELGKGVELEGMTLKIDCDFPTEDESLVKFKYKKTPIRKFIVDEILSFKAFKITVYVNDEVENAIDVTGPVVEILDEVPYDSIVRIVVQGI